MWFYQKIVQGSAVMQFCNTAISKIRPIRLPSRHALLGGRGVLLTPCPAWRQLGSLEQTRATWGVEGKVSLTCLSGRLGSKHRIH